MKAICNKILVISALVLCMAVGAFSQSDPKKPPPKPKPPVIKPKPKPKPKPESASLGFDAKLAIVKAKY